MQKEQIYLELTNQPQDACEFFAAVSSSEYGIQMLIYLICETFNAEMYYEK